jgi:hypothetical protein
MRLLQEGLAVSRTHQLVEQLDDPSKHRSALSLFTWKSPSGAADRRGCGITDPTQRVRANTPDSSNEPSPVQELQVVEIDHR